MRILRQITAKAASTPGPVTRVNKDVVDNPQSVIAMLRELRSSRLLGHDVCNILASLDVCDRDNLAAETRAVHTLE